MKIENRNLRRKFSAPGNCEYPECARWQSIRHCCHVFAVGMGGNGRLDVRVNLVGLCWLCHRKSHDGHEPTETTLLAIVAKREGTTPDAIRDEIYRLRRLPKETTREAAGYGKGAANSLARSALSPLELLRGGAGLSESADLSTDEAGGR